MADIVKSIQAVIDLLPPDGSEVPYQEFEKTVVAAPIDGAREALRHIVKRNLIGKRFTRDTFTDPRSGKPVFIVMVKRLS